MRAGFRPPHLCPNKNLKQRCMKKLISLLFFLGFATALFGQSLQQTVRGQVLDADNRLPLVGAQVKVVSSGEMLGAITDESGKFRVARVPIGRISIELS